MEEVTVEITLPTRPRMLVDDELVPCMDAAAEPDLLPPLDETLLATAGVDPATRVD
jgi:hypothetical protein